MGIFDKLLSPKNLSKATQAMTDAQMIALDKYMLQAAKKSNPVGSKLLKSMQNVKMLPQRMLNPTNSLTPYALALGGYSAGGISGKPFALSLLNTAKKIDPVLAKTDLLNSSFLLNPIYSASKPAAALTTAPLSYAAKGIDALTGSSALTGMIAAHPVIAGMGAGLGTLMLAPKIARGTGKLLSRMGRQRRLNLLRKGVAPKAYKAIAQQHGFR